MASFIMASFIIFPIVAPVIMASVIFVSALVMLPTFSFIPGFFGVVISRQVDPGAALRLGVVPPVVIVIIVIATVVIVGFLPQLYDGWQKGDAHHYIHTGRAWRASH
jgi:hypothetical protein